MKRMTYLRLAVAVFAGLYLQSCALDEYFESRLEKYTKSFIKEFGLVDPEQDWTMGKNESAEINVGPVAKSVKIYGKYGDTYYKVADLTDIGGSLSVPVHVPKTCTEMMVKVDGRKYYGSFGKKIDCTDMSRGVPDVKYNDDGTADNPNPALYTKTYDNGYGIKVQHTTKGNAKGTVYEKYKDGGAYQYFNTQQISPLISTTPWDTYYSENTKKWTENPGNPAWVGLLPESGVFNRLKSELEDWITKKKNEGQSMVEDFRITTGKDGSFTLFPYYYGTNLKHELGVYLLDDNGNPKLRNGTYESSKASTYTLDDFISFPVFQDRVPGDLQIQPHYDSAITGIRLKGGNPEFYLGEDYDLQTKVEIERNGKWISYNKYIEEYGSQFHSRVAYHFWVDEPNSSMTENPDSFARIYNNGIVHPLKITENHNTDGIAYANVAIATGLGVSTKGAGIGRITGVEENFTYKVLSGPIPHYITKEYTTGASGAINLEKWQEPEFFEPSDEYKEDVTEGLFMGDDKDSGEYTTSAKEWGTLKLDKEVFKDADNTYKLRIKMNSEHALGIRAGGWIPELNYEYIVNGNKYSSAGDENCVTTNAAAEYDILLSDDVLEVIQDKGIAFQEKSGSAVTFVKVELVRPLKKGEESMYDWTWTATGKTAMAEYLATYYIGKSGNKCDNCGKTFEFSNIKPSVTIMPDADYYNIHYTVTWVFRDEASPVSRSVPSREYNSSTTLLNPGSASEWKDVNSFWSRLLPHQEEVASYPPNVCMLARSRGYDVTITYGTDEKGNPKPWVGNLGMYLKVVGSYDILSKTDENGKTIYPEEFYDHYTPFTKGNSDTTKEEYVVFSQKRFNKGADGKPSEQISALSVKHPMSKRTFLTFEDMRVTRNDVTPKDFYKEKSSDRDVNDLIFNITNYGGISNDKESITESNENEEGFRWIWALEDLGSTGDFDFNDVVIRIKDITKTTKTTKTTIEENGETTTTTKEEIIITPEITFMPLAAGGTLPIHIHFKYGDKDFVLAPGKYDLTNEKSPSELKTGKEFHKWFDESISSSTMINTGVSAHISTSEKNACILIVDEGFKLENSLKFGEDKKGNHGDGSDQSVLYVVVQGDGTKTWSEMQKVDQDRMKDEDTYMLPLMEKGKAAQSFFILDNNGGTWRWMKEYQHICLGYPGFAEWIQNPGTEWTQRKDTNYLY